MDLFGRRHASLSKQPSTYPSKYPISVKQFNFSTVIFRQCRIRVNCLGLVGVNSANEGTRAAWVTQRVFL